MEYTRRQVKRLTIARETISMKSQKGSIIVTCAMTLALIAVRFLPASSEFKIFSRLAAASSS